MEFFFFTVLSDNTINPPAHDQILRPAVDSAYILHSGLAGAPPGSSAASPIDYESIGKPT
jgi:hypothetical protein